ncbi:MAG: hypothetical protein DRP96_10985 [Candidatus Neomarinimicrobiota bacterium]|nr:MAG: hypothetical protein DRP96_10985 [Candidatus Neomarinimicrobiota bacterium]
MMINMNQNQKSFFVWLLLGLIGSSGLLAGPIHRRSGIHNGNLVNTRYSNFGNLGDRYKSPQMEWPKGTGFTYGFEFIMEAAAEVVDANGVTVQITSESYTHLPSHDISPDGTHLWNWEPLPGYFNEGPENKDEFPAMSHKPETWPASWPYDYPGDPGTRDGMWNGEFGAYVRADQESYYMIDDRNNDEFEYYPFVGSAIDSGGFYTGGRRGIGLQVRVRGYQWAAVAAEDILIVRYDFKNYSHKDLPKVVFGMYADVMVGGGGDSGDDLASFDNLDDITYCWDADGLDIKNRMGLGYFGYAFLESPGNPLNGKDDEDGLIDEEQDNDRGTYIEGPVGNFGGTKWHWSGDEDGDWQSYHDDNANGKWDYGEFIGDDVGSDGIGPYDQGYPGPDTDGTEANGVPDQGEPNFGKTDNDESDQIGLTSFILVNAQSLRYDDRNWQQMTPGLYSEPPVTNLAFVYGSGYFELPIGHTRKFAITNLFGNDWEDILKNKRTMQKIYDADYNFTKPPLKPNLRAVARDKKVILTWDKMAELSIDPIYREDFEGYLVYKATDPSFNEIKTISDAYGNALYWKPIAQFDAVDGLYGLHPITIEGTGVHFNMGTDSGLKYHYIDEDVENGRRYFYAVCSYDRGYDEDFYERGLSSMDYLAPVYPTECSKIIQLDALGDVEFVDINCAVVTPNAGSAGYVEGHMDGELEHIGLATGRLEVVFAIPDDIQEGHTYEVTFSDTTGGRFTNGICITDLTDSEVIYESNTYDEFDISKQILEGMRFDFYNDSSYVTEHGWLIGDCNLPYTIGPSLDDAKRRTLPEDIEIRVMAPNADTSFYNPLDTESNRPVNFQVWSTTYNRKLDFAFYETANKDGLLNGGDQISICHEIENFGTASKIAWIFELDTLSGGIDPEEGDIFYFYVTKPFNADDTIRFTTSASEVDRKLAKSSLDSIYVVPDPYVVSASWEKPLFYASGRGERRIDFVNLPTECTIRIYSVSGKLIKTLKHSAAMSLGTESWDLVSEDGLTVSYGIYVYHVDAPGIGSKVGKFALIK